MMRKKTILYPSFFMAFFLIFLILPNFNLKNSSEINFEIKLSDDGYEENDNPDQATLIYNGEYPYLVAEYEDEDWYTIYVEAGSTLTIDIYFSHDAGDLDLQLYGPLPSMPLLESSESLDDDEHISYAISSSGSYIFAVIPYPSNPSYNLSVSGGSGTPIESINITSPDSTSNWNNGSNYQINWTSEGTIDTVDIDLYNSSGFVDFIALNTDNDGSYDWVVPNDITSGSDYYILIYDSSDYTPSDASDSFTITIHYPSDSINITNPTSASNWNNGSSYWINWTSTGNISSVGINLFNTIGPNLIQTITTNTPNNGSYLWTVPDIVTGSYFLNIYDESEPLINDNQTFYIMNVEESIYITNPKSESTWYSGNKYEINWTWTGTFTDVDIDLYNSTGLIENIISGTTNNGSYWWTVPDYLPAGSDYYIEVAEGSDDIPSDISEIFTIEKSIAEAIQVISPNNSDIWWKNYTYEIRWTWSGSITDVKIELHNTTGLVEIITSQTENNGSYMWRISTWLLAGNDYYILVADESDSDPFGVSLYFKISEKSSDDKSLIPGYPLLILLNFTSLFVIGLILIIRYRKKP